MVGSSIYTVTSVLTQRELDLLCSTYNIPAELRPELPDRNSTIKNSPEGKIGMYTRFIEFANYRIPLSKFLLCVLEYYQISLSQLSVIGAAKVSHFEIMYRALGRVPTVGTFRRFYVNSTSNGWLSFSKRGGAGDPYASVCPLSIPWFDGTSVVKDPLPIDEVVDLPCAELLNENRTLIRKYPKTFLCLVGLSHSFVEMDVRPTLLCDDDEVYGFVHLSDASYVHAWLKLEKEAKLKLPPHRLAEIRRFFEEYKKNKNKSVKVNDFLPAMQSRLSSIPWIYTPLTSLKA
ncbi:putative gypsy type transposase [Tanacetum coccineum]